LFSHLEVTRLKFAFLLFILSTVIICAFRIFCKTVLQTVLPIKRFASILFFLAFYKSAIYADGQYNRNLIYTIIADSSSYKQNPQSEKSSFGQTFPYRAEKLPHHGTAFASYPYP